MSPTSRTPRPASKSPGKTVQPELRAFAPPATNTLISASPALRDRRVGDSIVRSEGYAGHMTAYDLFDEMEDKDAHLFSLLQTRKLGLLGRRQRIEPGADNEAARTAATWLRRVLPTLPGWHEALAHLLDALGKGLSVLEIMWNFDGASNLLPAALHPRGAARFALDDENQWRLLEAHNLLASGAPLPPRKFIVGVWNASDTRPHGKGLCEKVYWYYWFKKQNVIAIVGLNEL